jgi:hypothetical protein
LEACRLFRILEKVECRRKRWEDVVCPNEMAKRENAEFHVVGVMSRSRDESEAPKEM